LICHTLRAFERCEGVDAVVLIVHPYDREAMEALVSRHAFGKVRAVIEGGVERQESVWKGLLTLPEAVEWVAIHDGARPLVAPDLIARVLAAAEEWGAAIAAVPETDTVKRVEGRWVAETLPRKALIRTQTPQVFAKDLILEAFTKAREEGFLGTDDASLVERLGYRVAVVDGSPDNLKVTSMQDLWIAETLLGRRREGCT